MSPSTILALAGVYGTVTFISNSITTRYLTDQWGRRKMILAGLSGVILVEIYAAVMQHVFQNTDNKVGKGFTILGIYLFALIYCKSKVFGFFGGPFKTDVLAHFCRWHAQQHHMALWCRGPPHCPAQQNNGHCLGISFHRQCCRYASDFAFNGYNPLIPNSHRGWSHGICEDQGKLLLRLCVLHDLFPRHCILFLSVSRPY